ncbi:hypothetical protein OAD62_04955 [Oceanihabitans sp.]|nr:hypothetical protein [Oceanihabitans sp.]
MKINRHYILFLTVLVACQTGKIEVLGDIPSHLKEISAIEKIKHSNLLWVIEDAGNNNMVYGLNPNGSINKSIIITNGKNNDWEDLTSDALGNLYIGDIGNNKNKHRIYSIYKIVGMDTISNKTEASRIDFTLPKNVKPKDFEAFFLLNNSFYLFSKNQKTCQLYKIPNTEGNHLAEFISKHKFNEKNNRITSADISPDGKTVVLLCHDKIWKLSDFKADDFFSGKIESQSFNHASQKEGICFKNNKSLFITEESNKGIRANIYEFVLD